MLQHPRHCIVGVTANDKISHCLETFPPQPLIDCFINNVKVTALIDTGSMLSILSQSVFDKLPDKPLLRSSDSITGQSLHSRGEFLARLQFSGSTHSYHTPFLVCNNVLPPLMCVCNNVLL